MTPFEIPLSAVPQTFSIPLSGVTYQLTVRWNSAIDGGWYLDIADATGTRILSGIPLVTGVDLLEPYPDAGIGGSLVVQTDNDPDAVPTQSNLGTTSHLYFVTP